MNLSIQSNYQFHPFHLVSPSPWPFNTSISLLTLTSTTVLIFLIAFFIIGPMLMTDKDKPKTESKKPEVQNIVYNCPGCGKWRTQLPCPVCSLPPPGNPPPAPKPPPGNPPPRPKPSFEPPIPGVS